VYRRPRVFDRDRRGFRKHEHRPPREPSMYVLDYMEMGNPTDRHVEHRTNPVVQGIGTKYFTLLEAMPYPMVKINILEKIDLGPESKVRKIIPIRYDDLTSVSRSNLRDAIKKIVLDNEQYFTKFFNIAEPVNIRMHVLELFPGIGKKTVRSFLEERKVKPFENFEDIKNRVKIDPVEILCERILKEIEGNEKYYIFVRPPRGHGIYLGYLEKIYGELL
jgi:putative nucleotide binding protein